MSFEYIILEPEQKELFIRMVEAAKSVPREGRSPFLLANTKDGTCLIAPSLPGKNSNIRDFANGDPDVLYDNGLLRLDFGSRGGKNFVITPEGFLYYEWLMKQQGKPVERIETYTLRYLEFEDFSKQYCDAYRKIKQAEELLWSADKDEHFTTIGHLCREVLQEFADQLYSNVMGEKSNESKSHDKNRIKAVIESKKKETGTTLRPFLDALYSYWYALSNLVQRQEHGGQKEGEPVNWEDSRRVVFQTVNVMVELDRTLGVKS